MLSAKPSVMAAFTHQEESCRHSHHHHFQCCSADYLSVHCCSPCLWLEVPSVAFPGTLSLPLSLGSTQPLGTQSCCFWQECPPSAASVHWAACMALNECWAWDTRLIQCLSYPLSSAASSYSKYFTLLPGKPKSEQMQQFTVKLNFGCLDCLVSAQDISALWETVEDFLAYCLQVFMLCEKL